MIFIRKNIFLRIDIYFFIFFDKDFIISIFITGRELYDRVLLNNCGNN